MTDKKDNKGGAAHGASAGAASGKGGTQSPPAGKTDSKDTTQGATGTAPAPAPTEPRKRNALSPAKQLAIQIAGLIAILATESIAALLTDPQKAQIATAETAAKALNASTLEPIQNRIKAIQAEFADLATKIMEPGVADKVKTLSVELIRQEKRLKTLTENAAA